MISPYDGLDISKWQAKTEELLRKHPLSSKQIVEAVLQSWRDIFESKLGPKSFQIGRDIYPAPQIMAFLLHELIPLELASRHPGKWKRDQTGSDKDLVFIDDEQYSIEIKTSSHASGIFGNRSYAQPTQRDKKSKSGYYLAVNFTKFDKASGSQPVITMIRFGWLDHGDWQGQIAASGQSAKPTNAAQTHKLSLLYSVGKKAALSSSYTL